MVMEILFISMNILEYPVLKSLYNEWFTKDLKRILENSEVVAEVG